MTVLFALPEYANAAGSVVSAYLDHRAVELAPSLKLIRPSPHPVRAIRFSDSSGTKRYEPSLEPLRGEIDGSVVVTGDLASIEQSLNLVAEQHARALVANWQGAVNAGVMGNSVVRGPTPLTWDAFMDAVEQTPIGFDADGDPTFRLAAGSEALRRLKQTPMSPAQIARWKALLERKREEFRARQRDRRIS